MKSMLLPMCAVLAISPAFAQTKSPASKQGKPPVIPEFKLPPGLKPDQPGTYGWAKSKDKPEVIAAKADAKLVNLGNVAAKSEAFIDWRYGHGVIRLESYFKSPNQYSVMLPWFVNDVKEGLRDLLIVSDGKKSVQHYTDKKPIYSIPKMPSDLASRYTVDGGNYLFFGVVSKQAPLKALLGACKSNGLNVSVEQRTLTAQGRKFGQHRLLISRPSALEKKKGSLTWEIIIDDKFNLPVRLRLTEQKPGTAQTVVSWRIAWDFRPNYPKNIFMVR